MKAMQLTDSFSWRRVWMLWRLYSPYLKKHLWAFPLVAFGLSVLTVVGVVMSTELTPFVYNFTIGVSIMYYFAPIALARRDFRTVSDQLPVLTSEKMAFLAIYFLLVTLLLTSGVQTLLFFLSSLAFPAFCHQMQDLYHTAFSIYPSKPLFILSSVLGMTMPSLTLMGIVLAKRSRILMGILSCLGVYVLICTLSGLIGGVMALMEFKDFAMDPDLAQNIGTQADYVLEHVGDIVAVVMMIVSIVCIALLAVSWTLIYKKVKRGGF